MAQNKLPLTEGNEKRNFKTNIPSQKVGLPPPSPQVDRQPKPSGEQVIHIHMDIKNYIFL